MKYFLTESQFNFINKELISENKITIQGCRVFDDKNLKEFCLSAEKVISEGMQENYSSQMESLLKKYFNSDEKIHEIEMEKLSDQSPIVMNGFNQIEDVVNLLNKNCPEARKVADSLKKKWLSSYNIYFKDNKGKYHLLNRLNTNYTAMAVLITIYYKNIISQVRTWTNKNTTPSSLFVKDWIDHFFNPSIPLIDPRKGWEKDVTGLQEELESLPNPTSIFNTVLKPSDFFLEDTYFHKSFIKALEDVRSKGFETEDLFEKKLEEYNIEHIRYSGDYSFVDMVLGIDFLIKQKRKGQDYWVPVQVKTSFKEKYNLIDKFKCTKVIKPELIKIDGKTDFKIGDIRGFEEYFCEEHHYCKSKKEAKKFVPFQDNYLESDKFLQ